MDISNVFDVPLNQIQLKGTNVRSDLTSQFSQDGIDELAENIRLNGLLQPIVLRGENGKPPYDVIVGQRRFLAHEKLGVSTIKATFSGAINDINVLLLSLSENMCRQEMSFEDTSKAITHLYNHYGKDERKVQQHTGFSIKTIRNYVKIEEQATAKIKELIKKGIITQVDARRVIDASQGDSVKADELVEEISKLTKYEKKRMVESGVKNPGAKPQDILREAKQPKLEETIILNLPWKIHSALQAASEKLSIDLEELTISTLVHWLKANDFLRD